MTNSYLPWPPVHLVLFWGTWTFKDFFPGQCTTFGHSSGRVMAVKGLRKQKCRASKVRSLGIGHFLVFCDLDLGAGPADA